MLKALCVLPFFDWQVLTISVNCRNGEAIKGHKVLTKMLLIMNFTATFFFVTCLAASAAGHGQNVSLNLQNEPLEKLFIEIQKQTAYSFVYYKDDLHSTKKIRIEVSNVDVNDVLRLAFKDQPLTYTIVDKAIIIKQKPLAANSISSLWSEAPPVTGVVRGPDGRPLAGVNVVIKGTNKGVATDENGYFSIEAKNGDILVISNVGYGHKEIKIKSDNNLVIGLDINNSPLDEVQIIAYGETSKRLQTGNVATVKSEDIEKQPVTNPILALQGRVPGLFITQSTGFANSGLKVNIQGQNSISNGNEPFILLMGFLILQIC